MLYCTTVLGGTSNNTWHKVALVIVVLWLLPLFREVAWVIAKIFYYTRADSSASYLPCDLGEAGSFPEPQIPKVPLLETDWKAREG